MNVAELEIVDKYFKNSLNEEERLALEEKMKSDPAFKREVEEHFTFLKSLNRYSERKALKQNLDSFHTEIEAKIEKTSVGNRIGLWTTLGLAASVALVSALITFFMMRAYDNQHQADFQILRMNVNQLKNSIAKISTNKKTVAPSKYRGTGFLVSPNGYIATSYHVVKTADSIVVENEKFGRLKTTFVYGDDTADIALLLITDELFNKQNSIPYSIRATEGNIGEAVYTLGYPREDVVYGDGSISALSGFEQNKYSYQVSIPANPGNSGGPMIDQTGSVVGIVNGAQTETRGAAFAVKSNVLLKVIKDMPQDSLTTPLKLNNYNQISGLPRVNQIKKWKDYVFMVKVYHGK
jgi:S1-C subfamily serine protease